MALAALLIAIFSAVAAVVATAVTWRQLHEARIANALPAVIDLFREYRSPEMTTARRIVFEKLTDAEKQLPLSQLPDDVRPAAYTVSHFLDNLGVMPAEGLMKPKLAAGFFGDTAIELWTHLAPCIERERDRREAWRGGRAYQVYFEDLAQRLKETNPQRTHQTLKRWRDETPANRSSGPNEP